MKGWLLEQAGQKEEGAKLQQAAIRIAAVNNSVYGLALEMTDHGRHTEAVKVIRDCQEQFLFWYQDPRAHTERWQEAESRGDFVEAAAIYPLSIDDSSISIYGFDFHRLRALAAIVQNRIQDSISEATRAQEINPAESKLVLELVPRLDKLDEKKSADTLFERVWAGNEQILKQYPNSLKHHQRLAILAATCHRREEEGKAHAKVAIILDPDDAAFRAKVGEK